MRKYVVTALMRCAACRVLYRTPTDPPRFGDRFYQEDYDSGFTTDCPDADRVAAYQKAGFRGTPKDFSKRIDVLSALGIRRGSRVLDYGASWGYGVWQLREAGFDAKGYELGRRRAAFAREVLRVDVVSELERLEGPFDVFLAVHVLEHIPRVDEVFARAASLLRPNGLLVAYTPNGASECRDRDPPRYHRSWGSVHPLYLDPVFYRARFQQEPKLLASTPYDCSQIAAWSGRGERTCDLSGSELLFATVLGGGPAR